LTILGLVAAAGIFITCDLDGDDGDGDDTQPFYTVQFNTNGGNTIAIQKVAAGETVPYPAEPTKADSYFYKWCSDASCTNDYDFGTAIYADATLYANWLDEDDMIAYEFDTHEDTLYVSDAGTWGTAVSSINDGGGGSDAANNKNYVIKVTGNFSLDGVTGATFDQSNIKVLIYAEENKTISLTASGAKSLLRTDAGQTLILRNITLQGTQVTAGLVYCYGASTLTIRPGTVITGNGVSGVSFNNNGGTGTLEMSGGTISDNGGGGVLWNTSDAGAFTMSGGTISGNSKGGVVFTGNGTMTMSGGTISGNGSGGVSTQGTLTMAMSGGTISGNSGTGVSGTLTMSGGTISGNSGGGVVCSGTSTMSGGAISGNTTAASGGGVNVSGTFTMSGGVISGNTGDTGGGVSVIATSATFIMSGGTIYGRDAKPYLANNAKSKGESLYLAMDESSGSKAVAKYSNGSDIIPSGNYTGTTLYGH
jgi:hypothetical protein